MKIIFRILSFVFFVSSCNGQVEKVKTNVKLKKGNDEESINFLDKKYLENYSMLTLDASSPAEHPVFTYLDCEKEGIFTVHFVPITDSLRFFWINEYSKKYKYEYDDMETEKKNVSKLLNNNYKLYNIFSYKVDKEYLDGSLCSEEAVFLKDNSIASVYLLDQSKNKWNLIKRKKSDTLPLYHDNAYFLKLAPKLFSINGSKNEVSTNKIIGNWQLNCGKPNSGMEIYGNKNNLRAYVQLLPPIFFLETKLIKGESDNVYYLKFDSQDMNPPEAIENEIDKENIDTNKSIGKITIENNKIIFDWYGLYDFKNKELIYTSSQFKNNSKVLKKCEEE